MSRNRGKLNQVAAAIGLACVFSLSSPDGAGAQSAAEPEPPILEPAEDWPVGEWPESTGRVARSTSPTTEWTRHKTAGGAYPNANEQMLLWLMNRARQDPTAEGVWLATSSNPAVAGGRDYFDVDLELLKQAFVALPPKPPAAFDVDLYYASEAHSFDLIDRDSQDHEGQSEKVLASGFDCTGGRFSVFSYASSALNAHAALNIDWGFDPETGMQDPPGHREAIMGVPVFGAELTNVGLAMVREVNVGTQVGPLVFSGAYCKGGSGEHNRFLVGTVWKDLDENGRYGPGEGMGGVTVMPDSGTYFAVTADAGGYAIPIVTSGTYMVTFSGGPLAVPIERSVLIETDSVLLDPLQVPEPSSIVAQTTALAVFWVLSRRRSRTQP